jgi:adenylate kinase
MNLIFFGAPGVGKGTQAAILAERLNIPHISTGAIFRKAAAAGTPVGLELKKYMEQGLLVPDELTTAAALEALNEPIAERGFILDGYPRNIAQAEALAAAMAKKGKSVDRVMYLTAPTEEIIERMLNRGRADDTREAITTRLEVFANETSPVLGFYRERDLVTEVNGFGEINEVHERIVAALNAEVTGARVAD